MAKRLIWLLEHSKQPFKLVKEEKVNKKLYESAGLSLSTNPEYQKEIYLEAPLAEFGEEGGDNNLNENDRWYSKPEYLAEVERVQDEINEGSMFGSPDHPEEGYQVSMKEVSHMITKLWYNEEDNRVWVQIKLIPTIKGGGCDLIAIHNAGGLLKGSARAIGFYDEETKEANLDTLFTVDIVSSSGFEFVKFKEVSNATEGQFALDMTEKDQKLYENKIINMRKKATIVPLNEAVSVKYENWMIQQYNGSKKTINLISKAIDQSKAIGEAMESFIRTLGIEPKETDVCVESNALSIRCYIKNEGDNLVKISELTLNDFAKGVGEFDIFKATYYYNDATHYPKDSQPKIFTVNLTFTQQEGIDYSPIQEIKTLFESRNKRKTKIKTKLFENKSWDDISSENGLDAEKESFMMEAFELSDNYNDFRSKVEKKFGKSESTDKLLSNWKEEDFNESANELTDSMIDNIIGYYNDNELSGGDDEQNAGVIAEFYGLDKNLVLDVIKNISKDSMNEATQANPDFLEVGESYLIKKGDMEAYCEYKGWNENGNKYEFDNSGQKISLSVEELQKFVSLDENNNSDYVFDVYFDKTEDRDSVASKLKDLMPDNAIDSLGDNSIQIIASPQSKDVIEQAVGDLGKITLNEKKGLKAMNETITLDVVSSQINDKWDDNTVKDCFMELIGTGETDVDKMKHELIAYFETEASESELKQWFSALNEGLDTNHMYVMKLTKNVDGIPAGEYYTEIIGSNVNLWNEDKKIGTVTLDTFEKWWDGVEGVENLEKIDEAKKILNEAKKCKMNESADYSPEDAKARFFKFFQVPTSEQSKFDGFKFDGSDDIDSLHSTLGGLSTNVTSTKDIYTDSLSKDGDKMFESSEEPYTFILKNADYDKVESGLKDLGIGFKDIEKYVAETYFDAKGKVKEVEDFLKSSGVEYNLTIDSLNEDEGVSVEAEAEVEVTHPTEGEMSVLFNQTPEGAVEIVGVAPIEYTSDSDIITADVLEGNETMEDYQDLVQEALSVENVDGDLSETSKKILKRKKLFEAKQLRRKNIKRLNESFNDDLQNNTELANIWDNEWDSKKKSKFLQNVGLDKGMYDKWKDLNGATQQIFSEQYQNFNESDDYIPDNASNNPSEDFAKQHGMSYDDAKMKMADREMNESVYDSIDNSVDFAKQSLADFYGADVKVLLPFKFDGTDDIKEISKAMGTGEGDADVNAVNAYYKVAIKEANNKFSNLNEGQEIFKSFDDVQNALHSIISEVEANNPEFGMEAKMDEAFRLFKEKYGTSYEDSEALFENELGQLSKTIKDSVFGDVVVGYNKDADGNPVVVSMGMPDDARIMESDTDAETWKRLVENFKSSLNEDEDSDEIAKAVAEVDVVHPVDGEVSVIFNQDESGEPIVVAVVNQDDSDDVVLADEIEKNGELDTYKSLVNEELNKDTDSSDGNLSESSKKMFRKIRLFEAKKLRRQRLNESLKSSFLKEFASESDDVKAVKLLKAEFGDGEFEGEDFSPLNKPENEPANDRLDKLIENGYITMDNETFICSYTDKGKKALSESNEMNGVKATHFGVDPSDPSKKIYYRKTGDGIWLVFSDEKGWEGSHEQSDKLESELTKLDESSDKFTTIDGTRYFDDSIWEFAVDMDSSLEEKGMKNYKPEIDEILDGKYSSEKELKEAIASMFNLNESDYMKAMNEKINNLSESVNKLTKNQTRLEEENKFLKKKLASLTECEVDITDDEKTYKASYDEEGKITTVMLDGEELDFETLSDDLKGTITEAVNADFAKNGGTVDTPADVIKMNESRQVKKFKDARPYLAKLNEEQVIAVMQIDSDTLAELEDVMGEDKNSEMAVVDLVEMAHLVGVNLQSMVFLD